MEQFAKEFFEEHCKLPQPKVILLLVHCNELINSFQVLLSVTGGAQDFKMLSSKLEQVFSDYASYGMN